MTSLHHERHVASSLLQEERLGYSISLSGLSASFSFISGAAHLAASINAKHYISLVKQSLNYYRFADYALSASLMWIAINILWVSAETRTNDK